jgi:hypothetical protein
MKHDGRQVHRDGERERMMEKIDDFNGLTVAGIEMDRRTIVFRFTDGTNVKVETEMFFTDTGADNFIVLVVPTEENARATIPE